MKLLKYNLGILLCLTAIFFIACDSGYEYNHLYFWITDCSGGCIRGQYAGWCKQMDRILENNISSDHAVCIHQSGAQHKELPDGI